jgi:hypothetical protein
MRRHRFAAQDSCLAEASMNAKRAKALRREVAARCERLPERGYVTRRDPPSPHAKPRRTGAIVSPWSARGVYLAYKQACRRSS